MWQYVRYYKNNELLYTSATRPTTPLVVDASVFHTAGTGTPGAKVKDAFLCRTKPQVAPQRTLYIGGLYEEELTAGTQNPPYTSYYTFGGKMVGMRRANYSTGNGQYRMVSDHLGSTTVVVDTSTPPQVVSRQYHKPYGEVAWQGGSQAMTSLTSIGYTGQRLDTDSGLMFYNARMYDPVLSHFVSADTIAADKGDPKTRSRYSYVLNNPVRYGDPTGHCHSDSHHSNSNVEECRKHEKMAELYRYGIQIRDKCAAGSIEGGGSTLVGACRVWTSDDLELVLDAIRTMVRKAGWSIDDFKAAMGTNKGWLTIENRDMRAANRLGLVSDSGKTLALDIANIKKTDIGGDPALAVKANVVHELAHVWDISSGGYDINDQAKCGNITRTMTSKLGNFSDQLIPSYWARLDNAKEVWAEAVAAYIYPDYVEYKPYKNKYPISPSGKTNPLWQYVRNQFINYGPNGPKRPQ